MTIDRREPDGTLNPEAINGQTIYITTASDKTCFMYSRLIELLVQSILRPDLYFIMGMDWHVPVYYGQMTKSKIDSVRLSSTFSVESFAREYGSIWIGNSRESWFNADMLLRRRCLLKCERTPNFSKPNTYYILGVDVGRYQANTAITVAKVVPNATRDTHRAKIVYLEIIHGASFITEQAPRIKKLIQIYRPREIVIDGNGLF